MNLQFQISKFPGFSKFLVIEQLNFGNLWKLRWKMQDY